MIACLHPRSQLRNRRTYHKSHMSSNKIAKAASALPASFKLTGKTICITGASRGIGLEVGSDETF
jgi:hypothetical protein